MKVRAKVEHAYLSGLAGTAHRDLVNSDVPCGEHISDCCGLPFRAEKHSDSKPATGSLPNCISRVRVASF